MKSVAKYNLFKGLSTVCTMGTPLITLLLCGDFIKKTPNASVSASGVFVLLLMFMFFKDKILENFKMPPTFILCLIIFIGVVLIENILMPIKTICIVTMATSGIDEFTFKKFYKKLERSFPDNVDDYKHVGFIFTTTSNLLGDTNG